MLRVDAVRYAHPGQTTPYNPPTVTTDGTGSTKGAATGAHLASPCSMSLLPRRERQHVHDDLFGH